jgi:subtilisin family serine protease
MRHFPTIFLLVALLLGAGAATAAPKSTAALPPQSEIYGRQVLVQLKPGATKSASAVWSSKGVSKVGAIPLSYRTYQLVQVPAEQDYAATVAALRSDPNVAGAWPNVIKHASEFIPNDPFFLNGATTVAEALQSPRVNNAQWGILSTGVTAAWDATTGTPNVVVAVIDTGISFAHEDLKNRVWINTDEVAGNSLDDDGNGFVDDVNGYDFQTYNINDQTGGDPDPEDTASGAESHGTACSSIIAGQSNNGVGLAGIAGGKTPGDGARIMVLRVGTRNVIPLSAEIAALDYAHDNGAHVISMSFGGVTGGQPEEDAVDRAWDNGNGALVLAAAGNGDIGNGPLIDLPAGFDNCVCVGATTIFSSWPVTTSTTLVGEEKADFSKTGPEMDIAAPGVHIISAASGTNSYMNTPFSQFTGTSAATPVVAGLAALLFSAKPTLTALQARDIIYNTADDLGPAGADTSFGVGRIDMAAALLIVDGGKEGDTNGDGVVDNNDVQPIVDNFGAQTGDPGYSAAIDANGDGIIDELDLFVVGRKFGT